MKKRLTSSELRKKFFYAESAAGMYDRTIDLVVPQYRLMHETIIELLKYHFKQIQQVEPYEVKGSILDVGSGTGAESIRVIKEFPNIAMFAIDLCRPMLTEFRKNLKTAFGSTLSKPLHVTLIEGDILGDEGEPASLRSFLPASERAGGYKAVITTFTIHHLSSKEKKDAYRRLYSVLEPGGILINGDLFSYQSTDLCQFANDYDMRWIKTHFETPHLGFGEASSIDSRKRRTLSKLWLRHYERDNFLDPIEEGRDQWEGGQRNKGQEVMLREVGFRQVANPFRFWQVGILWARK